MIRSMTGHGAGAAQLGASTVRVELRAVNQRHLDVRVRLPEELSDGAPAVEDVIRAGCVRGRIEAHVRWEARAGAFGLDQERARAVYRALLSLRDEFTPDAAVPVEAVLNAPGLFSSATASSSDEERSEALKRATEQAVADLDLMRGREGAALARDFRERLELLRANAAWVAERRPQIVEAHRQRLHRRIEQLLAGSDTPLDEARLSQEVAMFADRSDVAEELTRLASHLDQFELLLGQEDAVGRKLDFLVQEIGREINTVGSKANDASIAHRVVEMKAELERVREQVQNVL